MRVAWEQIGDVLTVNHKIRRAQLATKASAALYARSIQALPRERIVAIAAPVFGKVLGSATTLASKLKASRVPRAAVSSAFRKQLRPRGRLARRFFAIEARATAAGGVLQALDKGTLSTAPPPPPVVGATLERTNEVVETSAASLPAAPIGLPGLRLRNPVVDLLSSKGLAATTIATAPAQAAFVFSSAATDATLPPTTRPPGPIVVPGDDSAAADMRARAHRIRRAAVDRGAPAAGKARARSRICRAERARGAGAARGVLRALCAPVRRERRGRRDVRARQLCERAAGRKRPFHAPGGDELSRHQGSDVRAARRHLERLLRAQPQARSQQHDLAAADEPAVHRGVPGRPQPRVRARAFVARVPHRPARQLLPSVLGRLELRRSHRPRSEGARGVPQGHSADPPMGLRIRRSARTITATRTESARRSCW